MTTTRALPVADGPSILIVDDVLENRVITQRRLERMGYRCATADGGRAALAAIKASRPALVLLDFMMPEISGLMVLQDLRATPAYAHLPVIMLTARTDTEAIVASLNAGADDYVHKPIDFVALKARIDGHLQRDHATSALIAANLRMDERATSRAIELGEVRALLHSEIDRSVRRAPGPNDDLRSSAGLAPPSLEPASLATIAQLARSLSASASPGVTMGILTNILALSQAALADLRRSP